MVYFNKCIQIQNFVFTIPQTEAQTHQSVSTSIIILSLVVQIFLYGWTGVLQWAGGLLPAFVLLPFFALRMLGAGDIKLLSTLGGILGIKWGALLIVFSLLSSGLIGIIILIRYGIFVQQFRVLGEYFRSCFLSRTILSYEDANQPMNREGKFAFSYGVTLGVLCITFIYYFYG